MTPLRPFTTDRPMRDTLGRKGIIRARIDAANYIVDFGGPDGTAQLGFFGAGVLNVGDVVRGWWANESAVWLLDPTT